MTSSSTMNGTARSAATKTWMLDLVGRREGLPSGQVHHSGPGPHNSVVMATPAGLAIYDSVGVRVFTAEDGLSCNGLRSVSTDRAGNTWIGTDLGFDLMTTDRQIFAPPAALQTGLATSCLADDDGAWLATGNGLFRIRFDEGFSVSRVDHSGTGNILLLAEDGRGAALAADADNRLHRWSGSSWEPLAHSSHLVCGAVRAIAVDGPDTLLIAGSDGFCRIRRDGDLLSFTPTSMFPGPVTAIARRRDQILVGVGAQLVAFARHDRAFMPAVVGEYGVVTHLWVDHAANAWAATESNGVLRVSGLDRFIRFPPTIDVGSIFAIRKRPSGSLLLAGENGSALPSNNPDGPNTRHVLQGIRTWDLAEPQIGQTVAATDEGVLSVDANGDVQALVPGNPFLAERARALFLCPEGLLVGTIKGLALVRGRTVTPIVDPDGRSFGYVYTLRQSLAGQLWMTTLGRGLWHQTENGWQQFCAAPISPHANVYAVDETEDGRIAIVADQGLWIGRSDLAADQWAHMPLNVGVWDVKFTPSGRILVGSSSGLLLCDQESGEPLRSIRPSLEPGDWEFTTSRSLALTDRGTVLCGLRGGLVEVDFDAIDALDERPEPYLAGISWRGAEPALTEGEIQVQYGKWAMEISVRSDWRIDESDCCYSMRVDGFDDGWLDPIPHGNFRYTSLPVGRYELFAAVRSPIAGWGPEKSLVKLSVLADS